MSDRKPLNWWMVPKRDKNYQWWWGYQKVRMIVLPDQEKLKKEFIERHNSCINKDVSADRTD